MSGGVADVGVSAFGAVTLVFSVIFLTLFGLMDEARVRGWIGRLLYRGERERCKSAIGSSRPPRASCSAAWRISVVCGTVYGTTAVILDVPYPLALAVIAAILDLIPQHRGHHRRHHRRDRRALSQRYSVRRLPDRDGRLPADRELHPPADDHRKGDQDLRLHCARQRSGLRSALPGSSGRSSACRSRPASRSSSKAHCRRESSHRRRGRRRIDGFSPSGPRADSAVDAVDDLNAARGEQVELPIGAASGLAMLDPLPPAPNCDREVGDRLGRRCA